MKVIFWIDPQLTGSIWLDALMQIFLDKFLCSESGYVGGLGSNPILVFVMSEYTKQPVFPNDFNISPVRVVTFLNFVVNAPCCKAYPASLLIKGCVNASQKNHNQPSQSYRKYRHLSMSEKEKIDD